MNISSWKMTYDKYENLTCTVPCTMYSVLLEHGLIDDPYYGNNDEKYTALSDKGCSFSAEFEIDGASLEKDYAQLEFLGLDTICDIYVNSEKIDSVINMHRAYVYDVKNILKPGVNTITLNFKSPTEYFRYMENKHHVYNTADALPGAAHLRKALCMSGWDWGPALPDMGIFRPVVLHMYDTDKIDNTFVRQYHYGEKVELDISVETVHNSDCDICVLIDGKTVYLDKKGKGSVTIENPKLWWVRGYGEQNLYDLTVRLEKDGAVIDEKTEKIGLRTVTVSTKPDADGEGSEFCFVLNGVKIFAMGANYIPQDNLLSRINPQRTEELVKIAADGNFNCLRVWGGGYYPEDEFYEICDRYGFLLWQDFMVACANVWLRKEFKDECIKEAEYNLKRIRNHACLGLFCGNNEMEEQVMYLSRVTGDSLLVRMDYIDLYERILPDICNELAPDTFYWPSSPSSGGGFNEPQADIKGDVHFWMVWHGGVPFTEYRKHKFRFCSEYGFESYPSMKTIRSFCEEDDMNCFSKVMEGHQKCKSGNTKILMYLADNYRYPYSFESLVYASQLLQADAIKYGVEHFRRHRGYTMGSIFWQFNDCWPVASWSSVDYYGRYKALHYAAKKFYAPVAMGLFAEGDKLTVNISNEQMTDFCGKVRVVYSDSSLSNARVQTIDVSVKALTSSDIITIDFVSDNPYDEFVFADLYDEKGNFIMRQTELFAPAKYYEWKKPCIEAVFEDVSDGVEITFTSDVFAKSVFAEFDEDVRLSDNFFDIADKDGFKIKAYTDLKADELKKSLKIMSVYDIGVKKD